jgi:hypothetical protein
MFCCFWCALQLSSLEIVFQDHACRSEGMELARELDYNAAAAWVGHPYFDLVDNSTDFETKICRMISVSGILQYLYE